MNQFLYQAITCVLVLQTDHSTSVDYLHWKPVKFKKTINKKMCFITVQVMETKNKICYLHNKTCQYLQNITEMAITVYPKPYIL